MKTQRLFSEERCVKDLSRARRARFKGEMATEDRYPVQGMEQLLV